MKKFFLLILLALSLNTAHAFNPAALMGTMPSAAGGVAANTLVLLDFEDASIVYDYGVGAASPWTIAGSNHTTTTHAKFGSYSFDANNSNQGVNTPNVSQNILGSGNFTVEFWVWTTATVLSNTYGLAGTGSTTGSWGISSSASGNIRWIPNGGSVLLTYNWSGLSTSAFHNIAYVRNSGTLYLYVDCVQKASAADSNNYNLTSGTLTVGYDATVAANLGGSGLIDEFRISNVARYSGASYTCATAPFLH